MHEGLCLQEMGAMGGEANVAEGCSEPAVPHKLPAWVLHAVHAGERAGDVGRLTKIMRIVQRELWHHLHPVHLLRRQTLP